MLRPKKMQQNIGCCLAMLAAKKWDSKQIAGLIGRLVFAGSFRRPLLAVLGEVFRRLGESGGEREPSDAAFDEVLGMIGLLPFAFTNLRESQGPAVQTTCSVIAAGGILCRRQD